MAFHPTSGSTALTRRFLFIFEQPQTYSLGGFVSLSVEVDKDEYCAEVLDPCFTSGAIALYMGQFTDPED
jgi:hypothetical protein